MRIGIGIALTALIATAPAGAEGPLLVEPPGPYIHRGTGFVFPTSSGDFKRTRVVEYDSEATDVGVAYDLYQKGRETALTIYVYPAPPINPAADPESVRLQKQGQCLEHFAGIKASVVDGRQGARLLEEGNIASPSAQFAEPGLDALFEFRAEFRDEERLLKSEAVLYCYFRDRWLIAYRITAPAEVDRKVELAKLMAAVPWPEGK